MAIDKVQGQVIDIDAAPVLTGVASDDYLLLHDKSANKTFKVPVSEITAGVSGAIRLRGSAQMDDGSTTPTSIVVTGDTLNASISQGNAPTGGTGVDVNGFAYAVVTASPSGVQTQITGSTRTVFDGDQISWFGGTWNILELGSKVDSVDGQTGDVIVDKYTKAQSDGRFVKRDGTNTMTGGLKLPHISFTTSGALAFVENSNGANMLRTGGTGDTTVVGNTIEPTIIDTQTNVKIRRAGSSTEFEIYDEGNKPTPAEIGALPTSYIPPNQTWAQITGKPSTFPPSTHTQPFSTITGVPALDTADWSKITNKPAFATRWPTWNEVTSKPTGIINQSAYDGRYLLKTATATNSTNFAGQPQSYYFSNARVPTAAQTGAYTKAEVDALIAAALAGAGGPVGHVITWPFAANIPTGYIPMTGQTIQRSQYPDLVTLIAGPSAQSAVVPDWRLRFVRNTGTGLPVGTLQEDTNLSHTHTLSISSFNHGNKLTTNTDLGRKFTNEAGYHSHSMFVNGESRVTATSDAPNSRVATRGLKRSFSDRDDYQMMALDVGGPCGLSWPTGQHNHFIDIGQHGHTVVIGSHNHSGTAAASGSPEGHPKNVTAQFLIKAL